MATRDVLSLEQDLSLPPLERVQGMLDLFTKDPDYEGFDAQGLREVTLTGCDPSNQSVSFELNITPHLCNKRANLHGGAAAMLMDMLTSCALATVQRPGFIDRGHVSRTITMTYLRPVPVGARVRVECRVVAAGRNLASLAGEIKTMEGKNCVSCVHDKAVFSSSKL